MWAACRGRGSDDLCRAIPGRVKETGVIHQTRITRFDRSSEIGGRTGRRGNLILASMPEASTIVRQTKVAEVVILMQTNSGALLPSELDFIFLPDCFLPSFLLAGRIIVHMWLDNARSVARTVFARGCPVFAGPRAFQLSRMGQ